MTFGRHARHVGAGLSVVVAIAVAAAGMTVGGAPVAGATDSSQCPWLAPNDGSTSHRVAQVVSAMTTAQKARYLSIERNRHGYQNYIPAISSLCLPSFRLQDGPAGVAAGATGVTQLPAPIALAATWDPHMATDYGDVIGAEAHGKGINVAQGPMVNIARVPEAGRTYEAFGEDPTLVSDIAVPEIRAIQSHGVVAQAKHLVANNQEDSRASVNAVVDQRTLREIYLPPFQSSVQLGHVGTIMCAHNQMNGVYSCQDRHLLDGIVRDQWGYTGLIRSDNRAVHNLPDAMRAGDDIVKPVTPEQIEQAVNSGAIPTATLDAAISDVLRVAFENGFVTQPVPERVHAVVTSAAHRTIATSVDDSGTVLLRNHPVHHSRVLPLGRRQSIALIGSGASTDPKLAGGGSSHVAATNVITPLQAISSAVSRHTKVRYAAGAPSSTGFGPISPQLLRLRHSTLDGVEETVRSSKGQVLKRARVHKVSANYGRSSKPVAPAHDATGRFTETWSGDLVANRSGRYRLAVRSDDGGQLYLRHRLVAHRPSGNLHTVTVRLHGGRAVPLQLTYTNRRPGGSVRLVWQPVPGPRRSIPAAARLAARSDVAIVFANDSEHEGTDRQNLDLPPAQDNLIEAVARANPRTIVVTDSGGPVLMPWLHQVAAVVQAWYPGEMDGHSLRAILFGRVDPSGRLPLTFPRTNSQVATHTRAQWPGVNGDAHYSERLQVGYRWYEAHHQRPLFPFGFGLSYTRFRLSHEHLTPLAGGGARVGVTVRDTGGRAGADVVETYLRYPASAHEPPEQLRAFRKVALQPGQRRRIRMDLPVSAFQFWDTHRRTWAVSRGRYSIAVGSSSVRLPLRASMPSRWLRP